ncbi:MAG TPA: extracellular solute-binding protein, partial [Thermoflexales bacterium]|nr:extracellular solute-binding protein [Thermoflexales bacterium]
MSTKLFALSVVGAIALASCGAAAPAAPTAAPAKPTEAPKPAAPTAAPAAATAVPAKPTDVPKPAAPASLTYWGGLIFSDEANAMQEARIKEWGKAKNVNVTVVMINQNETVAKVSAAIEAGNMPDAFDLGRDFMLQLAKNARIEPVDDLYKTIGDAHGGWLDSTNKGSNPKDFGGKLYGIPFGQSGNLLNRRDDVLSKAG